MTSPWDSQSKEIVIRMYADGKTTRSIATALRENGYPITRNAVIGKIHRMKLPPRPKDKHPLSSQRRPVVTVYRSLEQKPSVVRSRLLRDAPPPTASSTVPLMEIRDGQCKAVLGYLDGQLSKALCCGRKTPRVVRRSKVMDSAWCDYHMSLYTQEDL